MDSIFVQAGRGDEKQCMRAEPKMAEQMSGARGRHIGVLGVAARISNVTQIYDALHGRVCSTSTF
jgi:hypothetical protein